MASIAGTRPRVKFWVGTPEGRCAKTLMAIIYEIEILGNDLRRVVKYRKFFLNKHEKYYFCKRLEEYMPWLPMRYERLTGNTWKVNVPCQRIHKMYWEYTDKGGETRWKISREHPLNHKALQPYLPVMVDVYDVGEPIPFGDISFIEEKLIKESREKFRQMVVGHSDGPSISKGERLGAYGMVLEKEPDGAHWVIKVGIEDTSWIRRPYSEVPDQSIWYKIYCEGDILVTTMYSKVPFEKVSWEKIEKSVGKFLVARVLLPRYDTRLGRTFLLSRAMEIEDD